jgi:hypothetical protein
MVPPKELNEHNGCSGPLLLGDGAGWRSQLKKQMYPTGMAPARSSYILKAEKKRRVMHH